MALEGIAYTLEAEGSYAQAIEELDALAELDKSVAPIARYHQGRILAEEGKPDEAKVKLEAALSGLNQMSARLLEYTREQVEARLALIDPSLAPAAGTDPRKANEVIRRMNEMIQQRPEE